MPGYFENVPDSGSGMSEVQLSYFTADLHQIRHQPYPIPTHFENVPDSGSGISKVDLTYFPADSQHSTASLSPNFLFLNRFPPNSTPTLPFANWF